MFTSISPSGSNISLLSKDTFDKKWKHQFDTELSDDVGSLLNDSESVPVCQFIITAIWDLIHKIEMF